MTYKPSKTVIEERKALLLTLSRLRYSGSVASPLATVSRDAETEHEEEFLMGVGLWLDEFNKVLAQIADTTTSMAQELTELRAQRKAVRDFLGLPVLPETL